MEDKTIWCYIKQAQKDNKEWKTLCGKDWNKAPISTVWEGVKCPECLKLK